MNKGSVMKQHNAFKEEKVAQYGWSTGFLLNIVKR